MRSIELASACIGACILASCSNVPRGVDSRSFEFSYSTSIPAPAGTEKLEIWIPVASDDPGVQDVEVQSWKTSAGLVQMTKDAVYGNRMLHVLVEQPKGTTAVTWTAKVTRYGDVGQGRLPGNARYSQASSMIPLDGTARELAQKLGVTDASMDATTRAKRIYDDVLSEMKYDKSGIGWGRGSFEHATTVCEGNCTDFHSRFIGVARAAGMPVRFTMGIPLKDGKSSYNSYHCWAHYLDDGRWKPVDISEADKVADTDPAKAQWFFGNLDPNRISLSFGRDVPLAPAAKSGPRNYFVFPYAEADGREVPLNKKENWRFDWRALDG